MGIFVRKKGGKKAVPLKPKTEEKSVVETRPGAVRENVVEGEKAQEPVQVLPEQEFSATSPDYDQPLDTPTGQQPLIVDLSELRHREVKELLGAIITQLSLLQDKVKDTDLLRDINERLIKIEKIATQETQDIQDERR
jgi:hypothetical protein